MRVRSARPTVTRARVSDTRAGVRTLPLGMGDRDRQDLNEHWYHATGRGEVQQVAEAVVTDPRLCGWVDVRHMRPG